MTKALLALLEQEVAKPRIMKLPEVCEITGLSKPSIYRLMSQKKFPLAKKTGSRAVGWLSPSIFDWLLNLEDA